MQLLEFSGAHYARFRQSKWNVDEKEYVYHATPRYTIFIGKKELF